jgi:protein phosphatase
MSTNYLSLPELDDTAEHVSFVELVRRFFESEPRAMAHVTFAARSHPGNVRENNEDSYMVTHRKRMREVLLSNLHKDLFPGTEQHTYCMAVADGMGGQRHGEIASLLAILTGWELGGQEIKWTVKVNPRETDELEQKARVMFHLINQAIRDQAEANPKLHGMGTTLTMAYSSGRELFIGHVGDTRGYLFREGKLYRLTHDHSLAQTLVDTGQVEPGSDEERRTRHILVNSLGTNAGIHVDFHHYRLMDGDRLLLCSDGLTDMVDDQEIAEVLTAQADGDAACQGLLDLALEAGGRDNITHVLADYHFSVDESDKVHID